MTSEAPTRSHPGGGTAIAVAIAVTNISTYAYTMVAARFLGPRGYGAFAALMGLLLVVGVLQLGLQATAARRIAAAPEHVVEIERSILRLGTMGGLSAAVLCLLLSPVIKDALQLDSLGTAMLVALAAFPMTAVGAHLGVLQGERRWRPLAALYLAVGVPRLVVGTILMVARPTAGMALLAVALTFFVPLAMGAMLLRRSRRAHLASGEHGITRLLTETAHNSHALLAFFAVSNIDVLVARNVLGPHDAGLYASGLIAAKAVLFLPQFVVVLMFPSMASGDSPRTLVRSIGVVAAAGAVCTAGAWALSGFALVFVGGGEYVDVQQSLWAFAVLGTLLAILQLLVYGVVARQARAAVYLIWLALGVIAIVGRTAEGYGFLLAVVVCVDAALVAALLIISLRAARAPARH